MLLHVAIRSSVVLHLVLSLLCNALLAYRFHRIRIIILYTHLTLMKTFI